MRTGTLDACSIGALPVGPEPPRNPDQPEPRLSHPPASAFFRRVCELLTQTFASDAQGRTITLDDAADQAVARLLEVARAGGTVYVLGNGGSASIAGHFELDLSNRANIRARAFLHAPALTALANDHGYDHAYARLLRTHLHPGDALALISSSGQSANMLHAADAAREQHAALILTLTGFDNDNSLRSRGDLNFYCPSRDYGEVEVAHQSIAHYLSDRCVAARQSPAPQVVVKSKTPVLHR